MREILTGAISPLAEPTPRGGRPGQFSIRTLLIATFLVAVACVVVRLAPPPVSIFLVGALPAVVLAPWAIYRRIKRRRIGARLLLASLVAAVSLYAVSIGPAAGFVMWLDIRNPVSESFRTFYGPIVWIHDSMPPKNAIEWYVDYWQHMALALR